jgi:hypothetical protein
VEWNITSDGRSTVAVTGSASFFRGINFETIEFGATPGIVWRGNDPTPEPGYVWQFSVSELKRPVVRLIIEAGWTYLPVATFNRLLNG